MTWFVLWYKVIRWFRSSPSAAKVDESLKFKTFCLHYDNPPSFFSNLNLIISMNSYDFIFFFFCLVLVSIEKVSHKLKTVFDHISTQFEARRIFNFLLSVWKCGPTRSFVFDIYYLKKCWKLSSLRQLTLFRTVISRLYRIFPQISSLRNVKRTYLYSTTIPEDKTRRSSYIFRRKIYFFHITSFLILERCRKWWNTTNANKAVY